MKKEVITLSDIVDKLKNNALFKISLGSKELFHSNFIESILSIESPEGRKFSKIFLEALLNFELDEPLFLDSSREKNHTDIQLDIYNHPNKQLKDKKFTIVIENKVKSLPDKDQLNKYYADYKSRTKENDIFVLLCLIKPEDFTEEDLEHWTTKTYEDIANALKSTLSQLQKLPSVSERICFRDLIEEYIDFAKCLSELGNHTNAQREESYDFFDGEISGVNLRDLRIHDLALKLKFQKIKSLLKKELDIFKLTGFEIADQLKKKDHPKPKTIYLHTDFTNSKALVDATICLGKIIKNGMDIKLYHCLSVQLQGDQLRYCSYLHNTVSNKKDKLSVQDIKEIHSKLIPGLRKKWFENKELKTLLQRKKIDTDVKGIGRRDGETKEAPEYCKFDDEFYFRYHSITKYKENGKQKVILRGPGQTTIAEILKYFKILLTYIIDKKAVIVEELIIDNDIYSYLKCEECILDK